MCEYVCWRARVYVCVVWCYYLLNVILVKVPHESRWNLGDYAFSDGALKTALSE